MPSPEPLSRVSLWIGFPLLTVAVWWIATVAIIFACGRRAWRKPVFIVSSVVSALTCAAMPALSHDTSLTGAMLAFLAGIVAWGWFEVSYYTGYVVGYDVPPCPPNCGGWAHFRHGVKANLFHELSIIAGFGLVWTLNTGGNRVALWTFAIHWWMHQSAKINVFLGVRNLNEEYLPEHLRRMAQFFSKRSINWFFPFSVTISTALAHWLYFQAARATDPFVAVSSCIYCILLGLAILEHWWLILPQPVGIWAWGLLSRKKSAFKPTVDVVCGFLGSGKTTLIRNLAPHLGEKTVVLVNEMGDIGLDGDRLKDEARGAAGVVELAEGCMCCAMSRNVPATIAQVIREFEPRRIIIEPSGAAAIGDLLGTLHQPGCRDLLGVIRVMTVVDGVRWSDPHAARALRDLQDAQVEAAATVIINKCDLLSRHQLDGLKNRVQRLNPDAKLICASFGRVNAADLNETTEDSVLGDTFARPIGFESVSERFTEPFDASALRDLFSALERGEFGEVVRAKGVFETEGGWLRVEFADHSTRLEPTGPAPASTVTVIGHDLRPDLREALAACAAGELVASSQ